jgi:hypothetical protein
VPQPPGHVSRRGKTIAIVAAIVVAFAVVAGGLTAAFLVGSNRDNGSASAGAFRSPAASQAGPTLDAALTAEEIYHTSPWEYDVTFDNGNHIQGSLELIETTNHPDCAAGGATALERQALTECTGRVEAAFHGTLKGTMVVSEQVLMFSDEAAAASFREVFGEAYAAEVLSFQDPEDIQASAAFTSSWTDGSGRFLVLTVFFSRTEDVELQQGGDDVAARNRETVDYLATLA